MNNKLAIVAVLAVAGGIGVFAYTQSQNKIAPSSELMPKTEEVMMADKPAESPKTENQDLKKETMAKPGSYKDYSENTMSEEIRLGNRIVLFFHAPWCPFCKTADTTFKSRLSEIPEGTTILKTDYDSNTALKQKYGVTYQHTFVQIDSQGNAVSKWNGGDIDNLKKYLK